MAASKTPWPNRKISQRSSRAILFSGAPVFNGPAQALKQALLINRFFKPIRDRKCLMATAQLQFPGGDRHNQTCRTDNADGARPGPRRAPPAPGAGVTPCSARLPQRCPLICRCARAGLECKGWPADVLAHLPATLSWRRLCQLPAAAHGAARHARCAAARGDATQHPHAPATRQMARAATPAVRRCP